MSRENNEFENPTKITRSRAESDAPIEIINKIKEGDLAFVQKAFSINPRLKADERDEFGSTLLMIAAEYGKEEICKFFISKGADVNAKDDDKLDPMNWAATAGSVKIAKMLFEKGAKIDESNISKETPLMAAANAGHFDFVKFLVEKGANVNAQENDGYSALMLAAYEDHFDIVKFLLEHGANLNLKQKESYSISDFLEITSEKMREFLKKYL